MQFIKSGRWKVLIDIADTVTDMRNQKHAHQRGVRAIRGIDTTSADATGC
jgi:ATP:corrinoid adenosyltransferase